MADSKISPYNLNDLKNTTDDALGNYMRGLSFEQDSTKTDVKLAFGYAAVLIAAVTFVADYKLGWEATKGWTAVAVVCYGALNAFSTYWIWAVEKGLVFEGIRNGKKITINSKTKKHDPTYCLTVTTGSGERQIHTPFTTWFTADGYFVAQPFQQWLASSVEMVGEADPKNALRDQRDELAEPRLEVKVIHQSQSDGTATGAESKGKGSKKSKRKG